MNAPGKKSFPTDGNQIDLTRYLPQMLNQVAARMNERLADELRTIDMPLPHWRIIAILKWRGDSACRPKDTSALPRPGPSSRGCTSMSLANCRRARKTG